MSKRINLDIKDAGWLHIVHNLQHLTSCWTTKSMQTTMVNAPKINASPLPAVKYGKSTKRSTERHHQPNEGKRGWEVERVRTFGAFCNLWSTKKHAAKKWPETHFLSNEEKDTWIENYVESGIAGAWKRVDDADAAISQDQEDTEAAENVGLTTREPKKCFMRWWFLLKTVWAI